MTISKSSEDDQCWVLGGKEGLFGSFIDALSFHAGTFSNARRRRHHRTVRRPRRPRLPSRSTFTHFFVLVPNESALRPLGPRSDSGKCAL